MNVLHCHSDEDYTTWAGSGLWNSALGPTYSVDSKLASSLSPAVSTRDVVAAGLVSSLHFLCRAQALSLKAEPPRGPLTARAAQFQHVMG